MIPSEPKTMSPRPVQPPPQYRIFVGAFITGELNERIQAVRERCDLKTARITPPHVTVAGTYRRMGLALPAYEKETIACLHALAGKIKKFELNLGGVEVFKTPRPVIYLDVAPDAGLLEARRALLAVLGDDRHDPYAPHLTLAMRPSPARLETIAAELRRSEWHTHRWSAPVSELRLMQRGPDEPAWRCIETIPLE
jgi:2'-5' RNA ligase